MVSTEQHTNWLPNTSDELEKHTCNVIYTKKFIAINIYVFIIFLKETMYLNENKA